MCWWIEFWICIERYFVILEEKIRKRKEEKKKKRKKKKKKEKKKKKKKPGPDKNVSQSDKQNGNRKQYIYTSLCIFSLFMPGKKKKSIC